MYQRICPTCKKELIYKQSSQCTKAERLNLSCKICARNKPKDLIPKYFRICLSCNCTINYINEHSYQIAVEANRLCLKCAKTKIPEPNSLTRNCAGCNCELSYGTKYELNRAIKTNTQCKSCRNSGANNPAYGKQHSEEHNLKISAKMKLIRPKLSDRALPTHHQLQMWSDKARLNAPFCEWCVILGEETCDENLVTHHILYKAKFPQYALEQWNARVLCEEHHKRLHAQDGY